ncbi:hypothetical protein ACTFIN_11340 [Clostridium cagae]
MDKTSKKYWQNIIEVIKGENKEWNWLGFDIDHFLKHLKFNNAKKLN